LRPTGESGKVVPLGEGLWPKVARLAPAEFRNWNPWKPYQTWMTKIRKRMSRA